MITAFQICDTRTCCKDIRASQIKATTSSYLGLILHFHLASRQKLGIDPLRQSGEDIFPRRPDGQTQRERPPNTEHDIPDDILEIRIQEEQDQIHDIHDRQCEWYVVGAERSAKQLVIATLDFGTGHDGDGATE